MATMATRAGLILLGSVCVKIVACSDGLDTTSSGGTTGVAHAADDVGQTIALQCPDQPQGGESTLRAQAEIPGFDPATLRAMTITVCDEEVLEGGAWVAKPSTDGYRCELHKEGDDVRFSAGEVRIDCGNWNVAEPSFTRRFRSIYVGLISGS